MQRRERSGDMTTAQLFRRGVWLAVVLVGLAAGGAYLSRPALRSGTLSPTTVGGAAQVGAEFILTNQSGNRVASRDLLARGGIVTFGWTRDPDMTPAALQVLSAVLSSAAFAGRPMQALFVTLDPARDKPAELAAYLAAYHPTLVGLTGTETEIKDLAAAYKLYWKRIEDASLPGGYSIDFASLYYVMGAGGNFVGVVPYTTNVAELTEEIGKLLAR